MALTINGTFPTAGAFYSYIKRISDGFFYDDDDTTFKAFVSLVDGKIDFTEDSDVAGEYNWSRSIPDGDYIIYTKETAGDGNAASAFPVTIKFGNEVVTAQIAGTGDENIEMEIVDDPVVDVEITDDTTIDIEIDESS